VLVAAKTISTLSSSRYRIRLNGLNGSEHARRAVSRYFASEVSTMPESHPHHGKKAIFTGHDGKKCPATITGAWPDGKVTLLLESGATVENVKVVQAGQEESRTCCVVAEEK
jgi:hypothetical protein